MNQRMTLIGFCVVLGAPAFLLGTEADEPCTQPAAAHVKERIAPAMEKGMAFLRASQAADGGWHSKAYGMLKSGQALTPFVLHALKKHADEHPDDRAVVVHDQHLACAVYNRFGFRVGREIC